MGILPAMEVPATDEVIDAVAEIEMARRETEKKAGLAISCNAALQRLNGLLDHESTLHGADAGHPGNVQTLKVEIGRVSALTAHRVQDSIRSYVRTDERQVSWRDARRDRNV